MTKYDRNKRIDFIICILAYLVAAGIGVAYLTGIINFE